MYTIKFFFTESASFKATSVVEINVDRDSGILSYVQQAHNADRTIAGHNMRSIDMDDLLYAVVKDLEDGEVTIIPSLYTSFEIVPVGAGVQRQKNIEAEAERVKAYREAKAPEREAKEAAKYAARRAARKAQYVTASSTRGDESRPAPAEEEQEVLKGIPSVAKAEGKRTPQTVSEELSAAGLDQNSIEALKALDVLK
jgi:hypothetical protein